MRRLLYLTLLCLPLLGGCSWVEDKLGVSVAAKEEKARKLEASDKVVQAWADRLGKEKLEGGGFARHEGLTERDAWGNYIAVTYHQEWFDELLTVRSAGPDGKLNTSDDLVRVRRVENRSQVWKGLGLVGYAGITWLVSIPLAFVFSWGLELKRQRRAREKGRERPERKRPRLETLLIFLVAPIAAIFFIVMFVGIVVAQCGDLDWGFFDGFDVGGIDF